MNNKKICLLSGFGPITYALSAHLISMGFAITDNPDDADFILKPQQPMHSEQEIPEIKISDSKPEHKTQHNRPYDKNAYKKFQYMRQNVYNINRYKQRTKHK